MWNPIKLLQQKIFTSALGIDIGTTSIKAVEVTGGDPLPKIINYGFLESSGYLVRTNKVLQASNLKLFEDEAADLLKTLLSEMKPKTNQAYASLPAFAAFMTVLDFPDLAPKELEKSMAFQAKQYIPLPLSEVAIDWIKVGEFKDDQGYIHQQILLISVPQETIKKYQKIFKLAGLNLRGLELESLALVRTFGSDPTPTIIVDIGSRSTSITFAEKNLLRYVVQSDYGGASLTQALGASLSINPLRAEELKKERGIVGTGPNYELSTIMLPFLDVIINEVKKAHYNYGVQFPKALPIERVVLAGGGSNLLGIERYVENEMKLPTVKAAPFLQFQSGTALEPLLSELNPLLSVSLGLTLKDLA